MYQIFDPIDLLATSLAVDAMAVSEDNSDAYISTALDAVSNYSTLDRGLFTVLLSGKSDGENVENQSMRISYHSSLALETVIREISMLHNSAPPFRFISDTRDAINDAAVQVFNKQSPMGDWVSLEKWTRASKLVAAIFPDLEHFRAKHTIKLRSLKIAGKTKEGVSENDKEPEVIRVGDKLFGPNSLTRRGNYRSRTADLFYSIKEIICDSHYIEMLHTLPLWLDGDPSLTSEDRREIFFNKMEAWINEKPDFSYPKSESVNDTLLGTVLFHYFLIRNVCWYMYDWTGNEMSSTAYERLLSTPWLTRDMQNDRVCEGHSCECSEGTDLAQFPGSWVDKFLIDFVSKENFDTVYWPSEVENGDMSISDIEIKPYSAALEEAFSKAKQFSSVFSTCIGDVSIVEQVKTDPIILTIDKSRAKDSDGYRSLAKDRDGRSLSFVSNSRTTTLKFKAATGLVYYFNFPKDRCKLLGNIVLREVTTKKPSLSIYPGLVGRSGYPINDADILTGSDSTQLAAAHMARSYAITAGWKALIRKSPSEISDDWARRHGRLTNYVSLNAVPSHVISTGLTEVIRDVRLDPWVLSSLGQLAAEPDDLRLLEDIEKTLKKQDGGDVHSKFSEYYSKTSSTLFHNLRFIFNK